jgi:Protein of unknown function (DUF4254)
MLSAASLLQLHDKLTTEWHASPPAKDPGAVPIDNGTEDAETAFLAQVAQQHRANFDLWHIEDEARTPGASDAELARIKRRIDVTNQLRNDRAENLDSILMNWLAQRSLPDPAAALHSESPGLMIDRLSIQALKIYHTCEEAERLGAPPGHAEKNESRLATLEEQRADLAACLDALWRETLTGKKRFKIYRQLKMYNDPSLNPAIYRKGA